MRVLVGGSTGLIGSATVSLFRANGHEVTRLVRSTPKDAASYVLWNPQTKDLDPSAVEGFDSIVHVAGENIGKGRWSAAKKERIRTSRVDSTRLLAETFARLAKPPKVFVVASAIGYYGDRGGEEMTESSSAGSDFLAEVVHDWELAAKPAADAGIRVVNLRFGVVLSTHGGALEQMLPVFRFGLGGRLGSGHQYMSWVALDDAAGAVLHAAQTETLAGPVNAVAPNPVTNRQFTEALGAVVHRPTLFAVPAWVLRLTFGEMADATLLSSTRVKPEKLIGSGYVFRYSALEDALRGALAL
jgi:hypothetical protein